MRFVGRRFAPPAGFVAVLRVVAGRFAGERAVAAGARFAVLRRFAPSAIGG
ncbi:MAG TPA: hypothetical protein VET86_11615 [Casimicrobiaceae bacterium]|nr:hypothetical protein [Casimicrobiaceae bacterium]